MWWSYLCIGCSFTYLCIGCDSQCCKGCLPTQTLLQERCVPLPLVCPLCEHYNEDDWHILFKCNDSVQERNAAGLDQIVAARIHFVNTLAELIMDICQKEDKVMARRFAMLMWVVWQTRKSSIWSEKKKPGAA
jgi:hypothetical protein